MDERYGIQTVAINKRFGRKQVLNNVSLSVERGGIFGLLGPSGCGKTTLVKIIAGILKADSGEAYVRGRKVPHIEIMSMIGYMAQSAALYPTLTAYENLQFFGSLYGLRKKELKERIQYVSDLVNLGDDLKKRTGDYSGGMKQRLSLAISLLQNPSVLILDEPTVGIDPFLRQEIWKELHKLSDQGVTLLVTTHVMDEAEKCHQLAMMRDGCILASGSPLELREKVGASSLEEAFIYFGQPADQAQGGGINEG